MKKNFFILNSFYSVLPGFFSILVSIFSIPIFLKILGVAYFGQYLIQNIFISLGYLLNFGLFKIIILRSNIKDESKICSQNTYLFNLNLLLSFFFSSILMIILFFIIKYYYLETLNLLFNKYIYFGLILTSLNFSVESLLKINRKFKILSLYNFFFNSVAFSLPAFFLFAKTKLIENYEILFYPEQIFFLVIWIKFFVVLILYIYFIKSNILKIFNHNDYLNNYRRLMSDILYSASLGVSFFFNNIIDKFFVKLALGNENLAIYSVPQQIAAKSTILNSALISVFFPEVIKKTGSKKFFFFKFIINIILIFSGVLILCTFPFLKMFLKIWLGDIYNLKYLLLLKIFLFYSLFASINSGISAYLESKKQIKNNSLIEILTFFILIFFFLICYKEKILEYFAYSILLKELLTFVIKGLKYYKIFSKLKKQILFLVLISIFFLVSIIFNSLYLDIFISFALLFNLLIIYRNILIKYFSKFPIKHKKYV